MRKLIFMVMFLVSLLLGISSAAANSTSTQDCQTCHSTIVQDFNKPNVAAVDKMRCYQCHSGGLHTRSYNGTKIVIVPFTDPSNGSPNEAYFVKDPNLVSTVNLHVYHSSPDSRASSSSCIQCHLSLSCTSCHQTIPHSSHSSTRYTPVNLWMTSGPFGGPATYRNSCATSNCHSTFTEPYMPKTIRNDGQQLCSNCHNIDKTGHTDQQLQVAHNTTFNQSLIPESNGENINCANCHESSLSSEHNVNSNGCIVCHGPLTPSEVRVVVNTANGDEAKRACEKCHFNPNVLLTRTPTHQLDHIAKKSNGLNVVGGPHATCNTCHNRTEITDTIKSLAYSNPKDYSCLDCHTGEPKPKAPIHKADYNGQQMAVLDVHKNCTSCHTPGSSYASKVGQIITDLATNPGSGYSCTVCHDNLNAGHKAKFNGVLYNDTTAFHLKCTDCHNENYKSTIATLKDQVKLGLGYDCSACHLPTGIKGTSPYEPVHQAGEDIILGYHPNSCNSCHGVVNGMYKVNLDGVRGKLPTPGYVCTDCHNGSTAGQALHQAKDENGNQYGTTTLHPTCATCHSSSNATIKAVISEKRGSSTAYACNDCHTGSLQANHKAKMTVNGAVYETTGFHASCETCHNNQAVYPTITSLKGTSGYQCSACHSANGGAAAPEHQAKLTVDSAVYATTDYHANCETCHSNEQVKPKVTALRGINGYLCAECHNGTTAPQANHTSKMSADGTTYTTTNLHPSCNTCHNNAAVKPTITSLKGQDGYLCESCHTGTLQPNHKARMTVNGAVYETTGFHASCETCHSNQAVFPTISSLKGTSGYQCSACHSTEGGAAVPGHQAKLSADGALTETTGFHPTCATCHSNSQTKPVVSNLRGTTGYLCSECHNGTAAPQASHQAKYSAQGNPSNTTNIHPTCATCHSNSQVSAKITALVGTTGYSCEECHTDIPAKHTSTLESFPVNCGWCHSSQLLDTHLNPTSVSPNMQLNGTYTCETCHDQGSPVQNQIKLGMKACLDCHNGNSVQLQHPDAQYLPRHDATGKFPAILTQYSPDCAACHNPKAVDLHTAIPAPKGPVGCVTCHNNAANKPGVQSLSINCQGCHSVTKMQGEHVKYHAVATPSASTTACLDCHKVTDTVTGTVYTGLLDVHKKREASTVTCASCHGANARDAVKQAITNNNTNCESCHSSGGHAHNVAAFETDAKVSCNECHNTDAATKSVELSKLHKDQGLDCNACHNPTFEGGSNPVIVKDGQFNVPTCSTCHDGTKAPAASTQHQGTVTSHGSITAFGTYNDGKSQGADCSSCHAQQQISQVHSKVACDTCHNSTVAAVKTVITNNLSTVANKPGYTCAECHNSLTANRKHAPEHQAINNIETQDVTCSKCHSFNIPVAQVSGVTTLHNNNCNTCHSSTVVGVKDFISARVGQANNPAYNCNDCHSLLPKKHDKQHVAAAYLSSGDSSQCATCHNTLDVSLLHKNVSGAASNCNKCHGNAVNATVNGVVYGNLSTVANKPGFTCDSCHTNVASGHKHPVTKFNPSNPIVDCSQCHSTDNVAKTADLGELHAAKNVGCSSCHNPTFEGGANPIIVRDGVVNVPACVYCHNGTLAPNASVTRPEHSGGMFSHTNAKDFGTYNDPKSQGTVCVTCHTSMSVSVVHSNVLCNTCHTSAISQVKQVVDNNLSRVVSKPGFDCVDCHNSLPVTHAPEHQSVNNIEQKDVTCGNCHSFNLAIGATVATPTVHKNCASCHGLATPDVVKTFVTSKDGMANQAYNCNDCHSQLTTKHNKQHSAKAYLSTGDSSSCAACHNTLDVSALHKDLAGKTSNCDKCHGVGVSPTVTGVVSGNLSSLANRPGFTCDSCHTGAQNGHQHPVASYETTENVACAQCHATDITNNTTELNKLHADQGLTCASCHNPTFEGGANPVIVKDGTVRIPTCSTCHNGTKAPSANAAYPAHNAQSTATHSAVTSYGTYTLAGNVNCAGCHTDKNIRPVHQTTACDKCHTSTATAVQNVIKGNWSRTTNKVAYSCADCHNAVTTSATTKHKPVHSVANYTIVTGDVENCNSCHTSKAMVDVHVGKTNKAGQTMTCNTCHNSADTKVMTLINQQARSAAPNYSCDSCHTLHGNGDHNATLPVGLPAEPNLKCAQCHDNDTASAGVTDLAAEHTRRTNTAGQNYTCDTCHKSTKPEVINAIATKNKNCSACHTAGWHNDLNTPHTSPYVTNPPSQCSSCHSNVLSSTALHPAVTSGSTTIGGGPVTYKIFRGTDGTNFTEIGTSSINSFSNTGLTANTRYYYQVAAVDQNGNVSTKSNVAFANAAVQETTTTVNPTSAAYSSQSNNGDSSSDGSFYSLSPSALTRLTDGRDSAGGSYDVRVKEYSSQDRWIYVRINNDAKNYTKVVLNIRASWYSSDSSGNLLIYPYQSNGTSIDTANVVNYTISNPSTNYVNYSIDVTNAAHAMDNDGFIKFRIKPGTQGSTKEAYISEVDFILTSGTAGTSGTLPGNAGTPVITGNGGDNTPPSTPASLAAQGVSTSQINLTWAASTDPTQTVNQPGQSNCLRCHDSTQPNVQTAIATKNTKCDACHTVHGDIAQAHTSTFVLNPTMDCVKCHTNRVDNEHLNRKSPTTGQQYTCDTCHKSTDPLVQGAIASNNTRCDACHPTRHSNVQSVHVSNYIPDTTVNCAACHTATSAEFTNTSNKARHVIAGTTSLATGGSYISPNTKTTVLDCRGCHKATNGTYYGKILVKPYTSSTGSGSSSSGDLCFICHDYQAYGPNGSKSSSSYSGFSYENMNLHVIGDHQSSCQTCHSKKPHGQTSREHFVVLKGETAAGTSAQLTKFIHRSSNGYNKSSCSAGCGDGDHP